MILELVAKIIYYQFIMVGFLTVLTLGLLVYRKREFNKAKIIRDDYGDFLANELSQLTDYPETQAKVNKYLSFDRAIMQEVLLEKIKLITGNERDYLIRLYVLHDFKAKDLRMCKSPFWWKRLNAITHLGLLGHNDLAPTFYELLQDPTPLVSVAAALSLSLLTHPLNGPDLIVQLPSGIGDRYNALCEIVTNVGIRHGITPLLWSIQHHTHPKVPTACIRAFRYLRSIDACDALNLLLKDSSSLSEESLIEIIQTVASIGAPSSVDAVRPYLNHRNPYLRAEAAVFLLSQSDPETMDAMETLKKDPSIEMKRAVQVYAATQIEAAS